MVGWRRQRAQRARRQHTDKLPLSCFGSRLSIFALVNAQELGAL
jgi:hypothetical protein